MVPRVIHTFLTGRVAAKESPRHRRYTVWRARHPHAMRCLVSDMDRAIARIADMSRADLIAALRGLRCTFKLDFTQEYLHSASLDRLRHIYLAASLHTEDVTGKVPA